MTTTFHQFSDLPPELRVLIWNSALRILRDVDIHKGLRKLEAEQGCRFVVSSTTPCPALLHTNTESRSLSRVFYSQLSFSTVDTMRLPSILCWVLDPSIELNPHEQRYIYHGSLHMQRQIFVNWDFDTISCRGFDLPYQHRAKIQRLKILNFSLETTHISRILHQCTNLRKLDLHVNDQGPGGPLLLLMLQGVLYFTQDFTDWAELTTIALWLPSRDEPIIL